MKSNPCSYEYNMFIPGYNYFALSLTTSSVMSSFWLKTLFFIYFFQHYNNNLLFTAAQVHVTANPLDSAATTIPAGRTTIVVQQPSLSLDYGGCSTILLREGEERLDRRKSRICSDHIQQLLDVTSQFTSEDLYEFDKRYDYESIAGPVCTSCTTMCA